MSTGGFAQPEWSPCILPSQLLDCIRVLAQPDEKGVEEPLVQVLAHLVQDEPVPDPG